MRATILAAPIAVVTAPAPRPWDHVRAALVAVHVLAVVGMSLPSPDGLDEKWLERPEIRADVRAWQRTLGQVGISAETTSAAILGVGRALERTQDGAERIFAPYARFAGVRQGWRMFGTSPARGARIEFWLREAGEWRRVYASLDPRDRWHAELWEDGRVRGALRTIGGERFTDWWTALATSAARRAAAEFPGAEALRLQRVPLVIPPPDALSAEGHLREGAPVGVVEVDLQPLRGAR